MSHRRLGTIGLALILILLSFTRAEALERSTAPFRVNSGDIVVCIVANAGRDNINVHYGSPVMRVTKVTGAISGVTSPVSCGTLIPGKTCQVDSSVSDLFPDPYLASCEVRYPGGKLRVTLCNITLRLCSDGR